MSAAAHHDDHVEPLKGIALILAAIVLAIANFVVVLDTTIANVSIPHIAGGLAVSPSQGTYVITSYAVAEAIVVPLTGWLSARFGTVRVFVIGMIMFGLCSFLCGLSNSLGMLVFFRILQGLSGGPLMPLSQTLLMRIFPKDKVGGAIALWSMTTLVAPIMGPILGGAIDDSIGWPFIFYINVPIAALCSFFAWRLLRKHDNKIEKKPVDIGGLILLVIWVGAIQILMDKGKELDWFASPFICTLAAISAVGFVAFIIWEFTEKDPIVDLRVFRHRGYTMSVLTLCMTFGAFFGGAILTPLWLQSYMGYTATWAGLVTGMNGVLAVIAAPIVAMLMGKFDPRKLVFFGVMWIASVTLFRSFYTTDVNYLLLALPFLIQGIGMPFFFVPLTGLALASVTPRETASAAGLMSFARTLSGAFATSIITTSWSNDIETNHAEMAGRVDPGGQAALALSQAGFTPDQAVFQINQIAESQSVMLATNHIFLVSVIFFVVAASLTWFIPKPTRVADTSAAH